MNTTTAKNTVQRLAKFLTAYPDISNQIDKTLGAEMKLKNQIAKLAEVLEKESGEEAIALSVAKETKQAIAKLEKDLSQDADHLASLLEIAIEREEAIASVPKLVHQGDWVMNMGAFLKELESLAEVISKYDALGIYPAIQKGFAEYQKLISSQDEAEKKVSSESADVMKLLEENYSLIFLANALVKKFCELEAPELLEGLVRRRKG